MSIPNSVTFIGYQAFCGCSSLTSVSIGNSVTTIGDYAFEYCNSLTSVTIPNSVTSIGFDAFYGCGSLTSVTIPDSVTSIGDGAFEDCRHLTSVTIGNSVTSIGDWAFYDCDSLTGIQVDAANPMYCSQDGVLFDKAKKTLIQCPGGKSGSYAIPRSVTSIGDGAFEDCRHLTSVTIGNSVTTIGDYAFEYCNSLTSVTIPNSVTSIGDSAFSDCSSLTSVTIPNSVTSIGDGTFDCCSSLTSVTIPNSVTSIGDWAFYCCSSLTSVTIPNSVTSIEYRAFGGCSSLTDIYYGGSEAQWNTIAINTGNEPLTSAMIHFNSNNRVNDGKYIVPVDFGALEINQAGKAIAYFRVEDKDGDPVPAAVLQYRLDSGPEESCVTDGNGIVGVVTPRLTASKSFHVEFSASDGSSLYGAAQDFDVKVKSLSYTQEWTGALKGSGEIGLSGGIGVTTPVAELEATLAKAAATGSISGSVTITDQYENSRRTLSVKAASEDELGLKPKSGIDGTALGNVKIDVLSISGKLSYADQTEYGIKIVGYDPSNSSDGWKLASAILLPTLASSNSNYLNRIASGLISPYICDTAGSTVSVAGGVNSGVGKVEIKRGDTTVIEGSLFGDAATQVWKWSNAVDYTDETLTISKSSKLDASVGIAQGLKNNAVGFDDYVFGRSTTNNKEISASRSLQTGELNSISYKAYSGSEKDIVWRSYSTDTYATVTYKGEHAKGIVQGYAPLHSFVQGDNPFINMQGAIDDMSNSAFPASVKETTKSKTGVDFDFPLGVSLGATGKANFGLSGEESYSYVNKTGGLYNGTSYVTTSSEVTDSLVSAQQKSLGQLLTEPMNALLNSIGSKISSAFNNVKDGVINAYSSVKGTVSGWFVSVSSFVGDVLANAEIDEVSYAVATLLYAAAPDSAAAVSATIGEPYYVAVYSDEACTTPVTDEQLADNPLTLTLSYTDDMLSAAGAGTDADILMLRFDSDRNLYVVVTGAVQDMSAKTVTASITKQGEYILAVDTVAPIVTDFRLMDETLTPAFTALVSDMCGIGEFSFWVDDGAPLVTTANLSDCYDAASSVFSYVFTTPLGEGMHTAYFQTADMLGNRNGTAFAFPFVVFGEHGTITSVHVPAEEITELAPFTVTVECSEDNRFTGVALQRKAGDYDLESIPMEQVDGVWTAEIMPVSGADTMQLTAMASDGKGNTVSSSPVTVLLAVPDALDSVNITDGSINAGAQGTDVTITVQNAIGIAPSGTMLIVAYSNDGQLLEVKSMNVGLTSGEIKTFSESFSIPYNDIGYVKAFLLDPSNGFAPECPAAEIAK